MIGEKPMLYQSVKDRIESVLLFLATLAVYYVVIKHSGHLRTLEKCRKHSPTARVFYISFMFTNAHLVLSQCNTYLRLHYLLISM